MLLNRPCRRPPRPDQPNGSKGCARRGSPEGSVPWWGSGQGPDLRAAQGGGAFVQGAGFELVDAFDAGAELGGELVRGMGVVRRCVVAGQEDGVFAATEDRGRQRDHRVVCVSAGYGAGPTAVPPQVFGDFGL